MSPWLRRGLIFPLAILFLACYLVGFRIYQHRIEEVHPPVTTLRPAEETQQSTLSKEETININTATEQELMQLDGIGQVLAERILQKREELNGFQVPEQLLDVKGIGESLYNRIKKYIVLE